MPTRLPYSYMLSAARSRSPGATLSPETSASCGLSVSAGPGHVFEDVAPRLADVTGDGLPEVIVVRSSLTRGAQLAVYGRAPEGGDLVLRATTPYIGQPHRWLAPAGIADIDGDGRNEIAYVDRPHLLKVLRLWRYEDGALREVAALSGVTNHRIGWRTIPGGIRTCAGRPEIIVASADWRTTLAVFWSAEGHLDTRTLGPLNDPDDLTAALRCPS